MIFFSKKEYFKSKGIRIFNYCFLLIYFIASFSVLTAQPLTSKLAERLHNLAKSQAPELVYIQTSKGFYETGEDLWFKAYIMNTQYFTPSTLSKTLYLQLLKEGNNHPVWQEKYEISFGFADGHVFLHDTLPVGNYLLAAFTAHSFFNDSLEFNAVRKITVKKDMKPQVSVTAKFNRSSFSKGDTISLSLSARTKTRKPLVAQVEAKLMQGRKTLQQIQATTNQNGETSVAFSPSNTTPGLKVAITARHDDKEEYLILPVPYHKGTPVHFTFFPEGGHLVSGIKSKVAFKAVNRKGLPESMRGILFENNAPLLEFETTHAGMGSFEFTPLPGKIYYVQFAQPSLNDTFRLPEARSKGITMELTDRGKNNLTCRLKCSPSLEGSKVYLLAQMRGMTYGVATATLKNSLQIKIPLNEFPQGIAEVTIFNEELMPVAERLVYVNMDRKLHIETKLSKKNYATKEKATLEIKVKDENGQPVQAHLGVSIYDKIYQNNLDGKNIFTHCYLSSQLKGRIYDPRYYFDEKNEHREEALDLLMLTQGWRKYVWSREALEGQKTKQQIILDGVKGEVHAVQKRKQAQGLQQFVMATSGDEKNELIMADPGGSFTVTPSHLKMCQGGYVYLKPMSSKYKSLINITEPFDKNNNVLAAKKIIYPVTNSKDTKEENIQPYFIGPNIIVLEEVMIKGKEKQVFRDKYMGQLDSIAKLNLNDDFVAVCGTLNCFVHGRKDSTRPIEGESYNVHLGKRGEYLDEYHPGPEYYGTIKIRYRLPSFTEEELLKMHNLSRIKAYYGEREFYQPNYDIEEQNDFSPDFRNTLLWQPSLITNKDGEATLEFFCSDINTWFTGTIEGIGGIGLLGTESFGFDVLKVKPFKWEE